MGKSAADRLTSKDVWLPPVRNSQWMLWNGTSIAAKAGDIFNARWAPEEIPVFAQPGTVIPLRTPASTHAVFVDPLVWAVWPGGAGSASIFEDAGDGLEYMSISSEHPEQSSAVTEANFLTADAGTLSFTISPTLGAYRGQQETRHHLMQYRCSHCRPKWVRIND